jgi:hypothetical protein
LFFPFKDLVIVLSIFWIFGVVFFLHELIPFIILNRYHDSSNYVNQSKPGTIRQLGLDCSILVAQKFTGQFVMGLIMGPIIVKLKIKKQDVLTF